MAILRIEKRNSYTVIDNGVFRDASLSNKALGMLCRMLSLPDGWEFSVRGLAVLSNDGVKGVMSQLDELEQHGYLKRRQMRDKGKLAGIEYIVSEAKLPDDTEPPYIEKPYTEKVYTEKPYTEKGAQSNNKESINKKSINKKYTVDDVIDQLPEELKPVARNFVEHRKQLKAPMTGHALDMAIRKAKRLANDDLSETVEILEQSIMNGWKGVFELSKPNTKAQTGGRRDLFARLYEEHKDDI